MFTERPWEIESTPIPDAIGQTHKEAVLCKICKQPLILQIADVCPEIWSKKFIPMGTCNHCYDILIAERNSFGIIRNLCIHWSRMKGNPRTKPEERKEMYDSFAKAIFKYMVALAKWQNKIWNLPVDEVVDMLMEKPGNYTRVLQEARRLMPEMLKEKTLGK